MCKKKNYSLFFNLTKLKLEFLFFLIYVYTFFLIHSLIQLLVSFFFRLLIHTQILCVSRKKNLPGR